MNRTRCGETKYVSNRFSNLIGKGKCKVHPCTGRTAHRWSRDIALLFLDHGIRRGLGVSVTPRPLFTPGKDPVPIVKEAGWALGPVWTRAENLATTGIRSLDRPARSKSLYRLSYSAHSSIGRSAKSFIPPLPRKPHQNFGAHCGPTA